MADIYKSKDIVTNINERGVDLGNINVIFYSMDKNTTALRIFIKKKLTMKIELSILLLT